MVEQWTSTISSNRKIYQHFKLQPERLNYFRFELYWPLTVKLILRFRLASFLTSPKWSKLQKEYKYKYDQPGKIPFMQMHAQMYKCTSYLQLATWTYGQVTRTVIFNPHHKQYNFKFSIGFTQSFFNNIIF